MVNDWSSEDEVREIVKSEYASRRTQAKEWGEEPGPITVVRVRKITQATDPNYFAGKVLQVWEAETFPLRLDRERTETIATGDVWLLVGPDPWEMFPPVQIGGAEGALIYYRMTQRYDAEGWRLDPTTGQRGDKP